MKVSVLCLAAGAVLLMAPLRAHAQSAGPDFDTALLATASAGSTDQRLGENERAESAAEQGETAETPEVEGVEGRETSEVEGVEGPEDPNDI